MNEWLNAWKVIADNQISIDSQDPTINKNIDSKYLQPVSVSVNSILCQGGANTEHPIHGLKRREFHRGILYTL